VLLLVALWIVVTYYFPDSRQMVANAARPVWVPLTNWSAKEEMRQVARDVADQEVKTGSLPDPRAWLEWLDYRYALDDLKQDRWGSTYRLKTWADSIAIWSYGPDLEPNTGDDFEVAVPRQRPGR
jgi:hypothetical protein